MASGADLLILPIQDVFGWQDRINQPATVADSNWTWRSAVAGGSDVGRAGGGMRRRRLREWTRVRTEHQFDGSSGLASADDEPAQFLSTAAAGAAMFVRAREVAAVQAAKYDLLIRGGRVIDPSVRLDAIRDVAIDGRPHRPPSSPSIAGEAADVIDARGKLVVPGLIDIHTHTGALRRRPGARAAGRRHRMDRCRIPGRRSHRRCGCHRALGAAAGARPDQHRPRRHPARRRHDGPRPRRRRGGPRRDRAATATSSSASRRGCRATSPARTTTRCCGAPRRWPTGSACR